MWENIGTAISGFVAGGLLIPLLWKIGALLWDTLKIGKDAKKTVKKAGNMAGLYIYNKMIKKITDLNAKDKTLKYLDELSDVLEESFDKGIKGEKI